MSQTKKSLCVFTVITTIFLIIFSYLYAQQKDNQMLTYLMFTPMISVLLTRLITKEGWKDLYIHLQIKKHWKSYLFCYLAIPFIAYFGAILYFSFFPCDFDPLHSSYAISLDVQDSSYFRQLLAIIPLAMLLNPLGCLLSCFTEEFAWRGYVLPKLASKYSPVKATILTNLLWGLWHAPIIMMGFNYGSEHPFLGVFAMLCFTQVIGFCESALFFKTKSIGCSVVLHAAINAIDRYAPATLFMSKQANLFLGPNLVGLIGGFGFIILAILAHRSIKQIQKLN